PPRRWHAGEEVVRSVTIRVRPDLIPAVDCDHVDLFEGSPLPDLDGPVPVALIGRDPRWTADAARHVAGHAVRVAVFDPVTHTTEPGSAPRVRQVLRDLGR